MKKWVTIFPECKNFHLIKDVGYIPYMMHKKFGFDSHMVSFKNDEYEYLENELKGLKIDFIENGFLGDKLAVIKYLLKNSKEIDVLQLFHLKPKNLIYFFIYKLLNKEGKTYLKLDANSTIKNISLQGKTIKERIYKKFIKYCDLISVETTELYNWLNKNWSIKVEYVPNGFWKSSLKREIKKENYITMVSRLGAEHKNSKDLIEAFKEIYKEIPEWKIVLVGDMTEEFKEYYKNIIKDEELKNRIIYKGFINDLNELDKIYAESKVFCLTSSSESFGLVYVEALKNGCYIVTSDVLAAKDITCNEKYGEIYTSKNIQELKNKLLKACKDKKIENISEEISEFAYEKFSWDKICGTINEKLGLGK
ncbi:MAG: glycosyltransferase family 4 protein [Clostridium sp.]